MALIFHTPPSSTNSADCWSRYTLLEKTVPAAQHRHLYKCVLGLHRSFRRLQSRSRRSRKPETVGKLWRKANESGLFSIVGQIAVSAVEIALLDRHNEVARHPLWCIIWSIIERSAAGEEERHGEHHQHADTGKNTNQKAVLAHPSMLPAVCRLTPGCSAMTRNGPKTGTKAENKPQEQILVPAQPALG